MISGVATDSSQVRTIVGRESEGPSGLLCSGYLEKRSQGCVSHWDRRYFQLHAPGTDKKALLTYSKTGILSNFNIRMPASLLDVRFADRTLESASRKLYLEDQSEPGTQKATCSCSVLEKKPTQCTFQLVSPERTFVLRCNDPVEISAWLNAFQSLFSLQNSSASLKQINSTVKDGPLVKPPGQEQPTDSRPSSSAGGNGEPHGDGQPLWLHRQRSRKSKDSLPQHITADIGLLSPAANQLSGPAGFDPSGPLAGPRGPSPSLLGPLPERERLAAEHPSAAAAAAGDGPKRPSSGLGAGVPAAEAALPEVASNAGGASESRGGRRPVAAAWTQADAARGAPSPAVDTRSLFPPSLAERLEEAARRYSPRPGEGPVPKLDVRAALAAAQLGGPRTGASPARGGPAGEVWPSLALSAVDTRYLVGKDSDGTAHGGPGGGRPSQYQTGSQLSGLLTPRSVHRDSGAGDSWMPAQRAAAEEEATPRRGYGIDGAGPAARGYAGDSNGPGMALRGYGGDGPGASGRGGAGYLTPRGSAWRGGPGDGGGLSPRGLGGVGALSPRVVLPVPVLKAEMSDCRERNEAQEIVTPRGTSFFRAATKISPRNYKSFLARKFLQPDSDQTDSGYGAAGPDGEGTRPEESVYRLSL